MAIKYKETDRWLLEKVLVKRLVTYELLKRILFNTLLVKDNESVTVIDNLEFVVQNHIDMIEDTLDAN